MRIVANDAADFDWLITAAKHTKFAPTVKQGFIGSNKDRCYVEKTGGRFPGPLRNAAVVMSHDNFLGGSLQERFELIFYCVPVRGGLDFPVRMAVSRMELTRFFSRANIFLPDSAMSLRRVRAFRPREIIYFCPRSTPLAMASRVSRPDLGAKTSPASAPMPKPATNHGLIFFLRS